MYTFFVPTAEETVANVNLESLPKSSLARLYDPANQGNSFSLDGFPAVAPGGDWLTRLIEVIEEQGALSMTTNQTLFKQLAEGGSLDERLRTLKSQGKSAKEVYWTLYNEAATQAAHVFSGIHARWPWDGRVSQEASALLLDLEPLTNDVLRIAKAMSAKGSGAFTKVPNVKAGPQALRKALGCIGDSPHSGTVPFQVHPNVTLVFSDRHYLDTVEGYLLGLQDRVKAMQGAGSSPDAIRKDLSKIHSVNSLFVSRTDRVVDPMIEEALRQAQGERLELLKGKVAVAQAKKVHELSGAIFRGKRFADPEGLYADAEGNRMLKKVAALRAIFEELAKRGANPQRLLIASSGVKSDQPYSPLLYVLPFLGPWSANTLPEGTLRAFSGWVSGLTDDEAARLRTRNLMAEPLPAVATDVSPAWRWDQALLAAPEEREKSGIGNLTADRILREARDKVLAPAGTSLRQIGDTLRDKGAASFTADEEATLRAIEAKLRAL